MKYCRVRFDILLYATVNLRFPIRNNIIAPCSQSVVYGFRLTQNERSLYTCTLLQCTDIMHHKTYKQDNPLNKGAKRKASLKRRTGNHYLIAICMYTAPVCKEPGEK